MRQGWLLFFAAVLGFWFCPGDAAGQDPIHIVKGNVWRTLAGIGDVDKDGYPDFVASTEVLSVFSGRDAHVIYTVRIPVKLYPSFGWAIARVGDIDKDGVDEFAVGAPGRSARQLYAGAVLVFSGKTGVLVRVYRGAANHDGFGFSVAAAGDIDRDGVPDIVAGTPQGPPPSGGPGYVRVLSGKTGKTLYEWRGASVGNHFGWSVSGGHDIDKDGSPDVVVGATNAARFGTVTAFSGRTGQVIHTVVGILDGQRRTFPLFGTAVTALPDVDGDGFADFAGSGPFWSGLRGYVAVVSGKTGLVLRIIAGERQVDQFGASLAAVGDIDGDGVRDLAIGAPEVRAPHATQGKVYVYSARTGRLLWTHTGDTKNSRLGFRLADLGDVNRDGLPDIGVSAGGVSTDFTLWILSGKPLPLSADNYTILPDKGGVQNFSLRAPKRYAGAIYLVLGSASGTVPGVNLLGHQVPLNPDPYFWVTASIPNSALLANTLGRLDQNGAAAAAFRFPKNPLLDLPSLHHAFIVFQNGGIVFASNALPLPGANGSLR